MMSDIYKTDKDPQDIKREKADEKTRPPASGKEAARAMPANANRSIIEGIKTRY